METQICELLDAIRHPETEQGIVSSGFLEEVKASPERIVAVLRFTKARDPFAAKIRQQAEKRLREAYPSATVTVLVKEGAPRKPEATERKTSTGGIGCILAVASGKGGVGKSTVTANLAVALNNLGYRVGILDADVYGPSQPKMFGLEGYVPEAEQEEGADYLLPAEARGIRIMSIGFFIKPSDALLWRGAMATNALRQMIHQTRWGELDFLLIDLPPGTGDVHLSILSELRLNGAVIVSTPQQVAVADVLRGIEMFRHSQVGVPVAGIIENMAWFTPAELPENRYYLFGKGGARALAERCGVDFLGEIPIVQSIMEGGDAGTPGSTIDARVEETYRTMFVTRTKADENFFKIRRPEIWNDSLRSGIKFSGCRPKKVIDFYCGAIRWRTEGDCGKPPAVEKGIKLCTMVDNPVGKRISYSESIRFFHLPR